MTMGDFSEHRLKYAAFIIPGQSPPSEGVRDLNTGLPFLQGNAEFGDVNPAPKYECDTPSKIAHEGDILMSVRAPVGAINVADQSYGLGRGLCAIRTHPDSMRFVYWAIVSRKWHLDSVATGSTYDAVSATDVGELLVPSLPRMRQRAIASFLDRETAKIDTLIAKKQKLNELLTEQRMALITQAVTKGLDPNVPMKDSGVESFGDVPHHWRVSRLRRFVDFITSGSRGWATFYAEDGDTFIRIGNLTRGSIGFDFSDTQYVTPPVGPETERTRVTVGDVLFSITAYLGSVAVVTPNLDGAYVSQHIALVRTGKSLHSRFLGYAMLGAAGQAQLAGESYGGTKAQLALDDVKSVWHTVPPLVEQERIADFLDREIARIDTLTEKVREAIDRLKEYRTALISAAVTGKIDVREAA